MIDHAYHAERKGSIQFISCTCGWKYQGMLSEVKRRGAFAIYKDHLPSYADSISDHKLIVTDSATREGYYLLKCAAKFCQYTKVVPPEANKTRVFNKHLNEIRNTGSYQNTSYNDSKNGNKYPASKKSKWWSKSHVARAEDIWAIAAEVIGSNVYNLRQQNKVNA